MKEILNICFRMALKFSRDDAFLISAGKYISQSGSCNTKCTMTIWLKQHAPAIVSDRMTWVFGMTLSWTPVHTGSQVPCHWSIYKLLVNYWNLLSNAVIGIFIGHWAACHLKLENGSLNAMKRWLNSAEIRHIYYTLSISRNTTYV